MKRARGDDWYAVAVAMCGGGGGAQINNIK